MKSRSISFCVVLLAAAGMALGAGNYQRTKDGKITVWNGDPKPGDTAQWFGGRDKEGYATGMGTLIWYGAKGQIYARYHGKMVRGKLDGAVDVRSHDKIAHAIFDQGKRTNRWAAGPASQSSVAVSPAPPPAANQPEQPVAAKSETVGEQASQTAAAPSPQSAPVVAKSQPVANIGNAEQQTPDAGKASNPPPQPSDASAEPRAPSREQLTADIPAEGANIEKKQTAQAERRTSEAEQLRTDIPAEGPRSDNQAEKPGAEASAEKPVPEVTQPTTTIQDRPEVGDLSGPPAELRMNSAPAISPPDIGPRVASSPKGAQLAPQEAMELADAEARAHGHDLAGYERPKADYSAVKGLWSFFYNAKEANSAIDKPPPFVVTVDEATKKAEVNR